MSKEISIIFGYRNRDAERVKNCLDSLERQTYKNFEVIFIDYGSDEHFSRVIKPLVEAYPFARYFYNHTLGMPWNRAHALNTGVRLASNKYILFGDVDLIYSPKVIEALAEKAGEYTQVHSQVYFLPKGEIHLSQIMAGDWMKLPASDENGKGSVHLVHKKHLEAIRGYDEYYCYWGVEDRDLHSRLNQMDLKSIWIDHLEYPVLHQWHPEVSGAKKGFFPDRWWENINMHYQLNIRKLERNNIKWGKLYTADDRRIFHSREIEFKYNNGGNWFYKGKIAEYLIEKIQLLRPDECLKIVIPKKIKARAGKASLLNRLLNIMPGNYVIEKNITQGFRPEYDLIYIIWHLIKNEALIGDYAILNHDREIVVKLMNK